MNTYVKPGGAGEAGYVSLDLQLCMSADEVRRLAAFLDADGWNWVAAEMLEELEGLCHE